MEDNTRPSYDEPPVIEVVAGVQFEHRIKLRSLDVAGLWESFGKEDFSEYQEVRLIDPVVPLNVMQFEISDSPALPRYLFESKKTSALIQFQPDRFLYNWKKHLDVGDNGYPRYEKVIAAFFEYYKRLQVFTEEMKQPIPAPAILELIYVNLIDIPEKGIADVSSVFRDLSWENGERFLPAPNRLVQHFEFRIPDTASTLIAKIEPVQLIHDGSDKIKFELMVRGTLKENSEKEMENWYNVAREWIVRGFTDLTTDNMHKQWRRTK